MYSKCNIGNTDYMHYMCVIDCGKYREIIGLICIYNTLANHYTV